MSIARTTPAQKPRGLRRRTRLVFVSLPLWSIETRSRVVVVTSISIPPSTHDLEPVLNQSWCSARIKKDAKNLQIWRNFGTSAPLMHLADHGPGSCGEYYNFWLAQAGWPQSHSSVVSPFAASQYAEQY